MKKDKMVTTVSGELVLKSKTRKISGEYYKIGQIDVEGSGDCYLIDDKYYRSDTGFIVFDHSIGKYTIYNKINFTEGVIGFDENSKPILGFFTFNRFYNPKVTLFNGRMVYALNDEVFKGSAYCEDLRNGYYYHRTQIPAKYFVIPEYCDEDIKRELPYDCKNELSQKIHIFNNYKDAIKIDSLIEKYSKDLHGLSLGLEFETTKGYIPTRLCNKLGLLPLRDGSVPGLEYVTIPMEGAIGLQSIINSITELKRRTEYDESCSLHLHIGNVPRTEEFILALFKVLCVLQDDIFGLFPLYKKYNFGYKRKHYTRPFPINQTIALLDRRIDSNNIKENFNVLFEYMSMGIPYSNYSNNLDNVKCHPSDPEGRAKWNIKSRYVAFNFIPLIFGNKKTIEFRLHTPTYDHNKIMNYIFMCTSIINYAKAHQNNILRDSSFLKYLTLNDIIYNAGLSDGIISSLTKYINDRTQFAYNKNRMSEIHFKEDEFVFYPESINWDPENITTPTSTIHEEYRSVVDRLREIMENRNDLYPIREVDPPLMGIAEDDNDDIEDDDIEAPW